MDRIYKKSPIRASVKIILPKNYLLDKILESSSENPILAERGGRGDAQLRIPMPEMQKEIHSDS